MLLIIIFVAFFLTFNSNPFFTTFLQGPGISSTTTNTSVVKIGTNVIKVEIADTPDKRIKGLSGRESIASDSGMLFIFQKPDKYEFWMKDMRFALDFIWINGNSVMDLLKNIPPPAPDQSIDTIPHYAPVNDVDKVLEVSSGYIDTHHISVGDKVDFVNN